MSELVELFSFYGYVLGLVVTAFDSVYIGDLSLLDIFIGVYIFECCMWFLFTVLGKKVPPEPLGPEYVSNPQEGSINAVNENYSLAKTNTNYVPYANDLDYGKPPKGYSWKYNGPGRV